MVAGKVSPKKQVRATPKKVVPSWTIRGVSEETKSEVTRAAKAKGVAIGEWVDEALSAAAKGGAGEQILASLQELKKQADPTLEQLGSRTDETLQKWRAGLIEQVGNAVESIQRLQQQLVGKGEVEEKEPPRALADQSPTKAPKKAAVRSNKALSKGTKKRGTPGAVS